MKRRSILKIALTSALIAALSVPVIATAETAKPVIQGLPMAERTVPVPVGVSPELAELIGSRQVETLGEVPATTDEWLALQSAFDAASIEGVERLLEMTGATFTTEDIAGVTTYRVTPSEIAPRWADTVFVHVHGGAFVFNGGKAAMTEAIWLANGLGVEVISVDYRRPPLHAFPAATDDVIAVWNEVIEQYDPNQIAMFGTSAGGNLTLSTVLQLRDMGAPLPGAIMAGTPAVDLAHASDSWKTMEGLDPLGSRDGVIEGTFEVYSDGLDLEDPRLSPVYGDLDGFPATVLLTGTRDLLLSDTVRMHRALRTADVEADLHVYDGQSHGDYMSGLFVDAPETQDALRELNTFFDLHLE
ncbi:alpha/beta hydrolase [Shimia sp. Alg240-R146]|uniref:alpha/beta hydrolase n=1 Tax=Shimia sp. Alg240-R146 TaxID=2993449 RepID=UPI000D5518AF|nr:alpha/beta hydrolase [Shimia sp. Alg240-R146]